MARFSCQKILGSDKTNRHPGKLLRQALVSRVLSSQRLYEHRPRRSLFVVNGFAAQRCSPVGRLLNQTFGRSCRAQSLLEKSEMSSYVRHLPAPMRGFESLINGEGPFATQAEAEAAAEVILFMLVGNDKSPYPLAALRDLLDQHRLAEPYIAQADSGLYVNTLDDSAHVFVHEARESVLAALRELAEPAPSLEAQRERLQQRRNS